MEKTGRSMAKGAAWMVLFKLMERLLGLASTVLLARLLAPADFGLVAMATSVIALLELIAAFNFDVPLIQRRDSSRELLDTAWTLNVIMRMVVGLLCVLAADPVASFYHEPRVAPIMYVLAGGLVVGAFENIGTVAFRREMQFQREFSFLLAKKVLSVAVTVGVALTLRTYWALVAGMVLGTAISVVLSYVMHPYRPRFSLAARRELLGFSKWLLINNLLFVVIHRGPELVIGRLLGARWLGVYNLAYEFGTLPTSEIASPINRAILPGYSRLAADIPQLRESFLAVIGMIAVLGIPAAVGISSVAEPMVRVILGANWLECVPVIRVVAFCGLVMVMQTNFGYVFMALGRPQIVTAIAALHATALMASVLYLAPAHGLVGAAAAGLATALFLMPVAYATVMRLLDIRLAAYLRVLVRPMAAAAAMFAALSAIAALLGSFPERSPLAALLAMVVIGASAYAAALALLWVLAGRPAGAEARLLDEFMLRLASLRVALRRASTAAPK